MRPADPRFAAWLLDETGIDAESLGANALARAVGARAAATLEVQADLHPAATRKDWMSGAALPEWAYEAYWQRLTSTPAERQALIDALVVPETWFFREREAFAALARLGAKRLAAQPGDVLRVLSAPCSSGEEPYSAAMALLDAGLAPGQFAIDAIDISAQSIAAAARGVYGRNAFRGDGLAFRERYFEATPDGWRIAAAVRRAVTFERANLFDWLAPHPVRYDFIFCRNVLIYFDRASQDRAIDLLRARLTAGGMIFVGPAETGLMMRHEMVSAYIPLAFGFRAPEPGATADHHPASPAAVPPALTPLPVIAAAAAAPAFGSAPVFAPMFAPLDAPLAAAARAPAPPRLSLRPLHGAPAPRTAAVVNAHAVPRQSAGSTPEAALADARRLADAGALDEAERLAAQAAQALAQNPDTWYLLGLIADAQGRAAVALAHYRKAIYLEPSHYEALTHLAALLEVQGDAEGARRLMRRAQRAAQEVGSRGAADAGGSHA
ncbi:CheR family methyltransferase [Paraburkholderia silvatlantica]|uniref:CheR-type MCP methyltransferase n=1 Tax=Paraburkholderia silvatlantica TaxID=321895 RepID=A0A2V4TCV9_9BURK|nr:protein-glutamate O-methyltransferase CheR [Paraburkholderia silvatlantica]PYE21661.1 CheR-type MCP methyltransferase [Paraburkholderia silvatlantica]TDQ86784.1 CheR-type MCP methyltransferase [Paraburkholderia silvatlantica]